MPAPTADGFAAGTTGGAAGATVTVTTAADLARYAGADQPYVLTVTGVIALTGQIKVASNKTIVGAAKGAGLTGGGLNIRNVTNVIVRNLTISLATGTDAISVYGSQHVWITQNDLSSDMTHGKDYYDGLLDITKASDLVTVSWNRFHDHYKVMLISASDDDTADRGKLHVTIHHNWFTNVNSRLPSLRFGTGHVYDNVFQTADTAVNSRMGAVVLLESNVFRGVGTPVITTGYSTEPGTAILSSDHPNDFGNATPAGTAASSSTVQLPYAYLAEPAATIAASVPAGAGPR
ncbi:polysaccharide lyase family 1 protein [Frankia sp. Cas3]|uniref:pectate lyase family protein n=1 Tax=Frankia sp. Cas3 TaxID=3073926 RepID=UPI002AD498A1|nr:polysaccharide lyase family 1 protein [Frankia sp. Cas3]